MLATPGIGAAADGLVPKQPLTADLGTGSLPCATGDARLYVNSVPQLTARLHGPGDKQPGEADRVRGEYEAWWRGEDGVEERLAFTTSTMSDTAPFSWQLPATVPAETVVSWRVRAVNDAGASAWSSDGSGHPCEFVYDRTAPAAPVVSSSDYPADDVWREGVGRRGTFRFQASDDDVVAFVYDVSAKGAPRTVATGPDGAADIRWMPEEKGVHVLHVQTQDRAGNRSAPVNYYIRVSEGAGPVARWQLADATGSRSAAAQAGPAARAGAGVAFGAPAPAGTPLTSTAMLDGSGHGFLTPGVPAVDTTRDFSVGGWVRPARVDGTRTVLSQDADGAPAFTMGLRQAGAGPVWSFAVGEERVVGGLPASGEWAHVLGRYDAETGTARLYVNGRAVGEETEASPAEVQGDFQIGRARGTLGYRDRWQGEIGDVRVYDRVVVAGEVAELSRRKARQLAHWGLETAPNGLSPETGGGEALRLGAGASLFSMADGPCDVFDPDCVQDYPLEVVGEGHLRLDGVTGHAATEAPVVDTTDSFTVSARVRLSDNEPAAPMTAISQGGTHGDAFKIRFDPATSSWDVVMSHADEPGARETVLSQIERPDGDVGSGHRLTVVYDAAADEVSFYLDGMKLYDGTAAFDSAWESTGGLQIGRGRTVDGWGEYLHGAVDSVYVFAGALTEQEITQLM
ncbi:LamG domain-containing protein [Streptomyces nitrosporeus]|uniref:LamG domain-containing protein n=1 Tax=Streptomyces nitrosporeus TaxID=28894 RepID=A0A5J6FBC7_9ACTN|nr:LamG domain-containing protein [Streptomyces nitrosporeus]GGZ12010.1 hypothetical protein GCM10010327_48560 [Streptomyces nitrosporeus]